MVAEEDRQSTFNTYPVVHGINSRLQHDDATMSRVIHGVDLSIIILQPSKGTRGTYPRTLMGNASRCSTVCAFQCSSGKACLSSTRGYGSPCACTDCRW